jgi:hypothetical protein
VLWSGSPLARGASGALAQVLHWLGGFRLLWLTLSTGAVVPEGALVIAITTAAIIQPAAIHKPPKMIHSRFRSTEMGDILGLLLASFSATMGFTHQQLVSFAYWTA